MRDSLTFTAAVTARLRQVAKEPVGELADLGSEVDIFLEPALQLLQGGKRFRAQLAALGWSVVRPNSNWDEPALKMAGSALELFQTAALVHDDLIDGADTRRGIPAAHRQYGARHGYAGSRGNSDEYGLNAAVLLGDLLLALSYREIERAVQSATEGAQLATRVNAMRIWEVMTAEVAIGQFLDVEAATLPLPAEGDAAAHAAAIDRAMKVLLHKSARYSVAWPFSLGAALAGADTVLFPLLEEIGVPLGEAFQLRDDDLGVFGDPSRTGKPAGDDLMEGKRTPLVLLGLARTAGADRAAIIAALGNRDLDSTGAERVRNILIESGAVSAHEEMIAIRRQGALAAIERAPIDPAIASVLHETTASLTDRDH